MDTKKFYAKNNYTSYCICEKECTQCLACINYCPVKAIQYGKGTDKKVDIQILRLRLMR